jgi:hypothetical protein
MTPPRHGPGAREQRSKPATSDYFSSLLPGRTSSGVIRALSEAQIREKLVMEFAEYFMLGPVTDAHGEFKFHPADWWFEKGRVNFPHIAPLARKYLIVVATSAGVERVFSEAKFWARDERALIGDEMLDVCVVLGSVFRQPGFDKSSIFASYSPPKRAAPSHSHSV